MAAASGTTCGLSVGRRRTGSSSRPSPPTLLLLVAEHRRFEPLCDLCAICLRHVEFFREVVLSRVTSFGCFGRRDICSASGLALRLLLFGAEDLLRCGLRFRCCLWFRCCVGLRIVLLFCVTACDFCFGCFAAGLPAFRICVYV